METLTPSRGEPAAPPEGLPRVLGDLRGAVDGPTLLVTSGLHGNEPAGVHASRRLLDALRQWSPPIRGRLLCLAGNLEALPQGVRFLDKDLNREWTRQSVASVLAPEGEIQSPEGRQMLGLITEIGRALEEATGEVYFLDLHTCSASGHPFLTLGDTLRNRSFAREIPLPVVLGLEEQVDGSLLEYLNNLGCITLGVEGGQHDDPASVDRLEAVLAFALVSAGLLQPAEIPELPRYEAMLADLTRGTPRVVEVYDRHPTTEGDGFVMEPGFSNIHPVEEGRLLARDDLGEYRAPEDGLVLLPRYQGQGNDGFFLAREVSPFWLRVSAALRRARASRLVRLLPGVHRIPERAGTYQVDLRIARLFPVQLFHLLGFRKVRHHGDHLVVSRRVFDREGPTGGISISI